MSTMDIMRVALVVVTLALVLTRQTTASSTEDEVVVLHFSDYHSHATSFYSEGAPGQGGVARLMGHLRTQRESYNAQYHANATLIFNGGDMMNVGAPAWSDKYHCVEWNWLGGIVEAAAVGNHDGDYGAAVFEGCLAETPYPLLSSNIRRGSDGTAIFTTTVSNDNGNDNRDEAEPTTYLVFERGTNKRRIGVFGLASEDFRGMFERDGSTCRFAGTVQPSSCLLGDRIETARRVVERLRQQERVDAVVLIGHSAYEEDEQVAQAVPGIDLILGTHTHRKEALHRIDGSKTFIVSPFQYGTYVSHTRLIFDSTEQPANGLKAVSSKLVKMDASVPVDTEVDAQVKTMRQALVDDPDYAYLFVEIGSANGALELDGSLSGESLLGNFVCDTLRTSLAVDVALVLTSNLRQPIPPGTVYEETIHDAMPYASPLVVYALSGDAILNMMAYSAAHSGFDTFTQLSGLRVSLVLPPATLVPTLDRVSVYNASSASFVPLDPAHTYTVATTVYQAQVAQGYKDFFATGELLQTPTDDLYALVRRAFTTSSPVTSSLDGRIKVTPAHGNQPLSDTVATIIAVAIIAFLACIAIGYLVVRIKFVPRRVLVTVDDV